MNENTPPNRSFFGTVAEVARVLLSILLAALFVIILSASLLGWTSYNILRQPGNYTTLAKQTQLTTRLRGVVVSTLITATLKDNILFMAVDLQKIPPQTWDNIAAALLPTGWLDENFNRVIQVLLAWFKGNSSTLPDLSLDLTPLKKTLSSSKGALVILPLLQDIPMCANGEVSQFGKGGLVTCLPADQDLSLIAIQVSALLAMQMPDQISLQSETLFPPEARQSLEKARTTFKAVDLALIFGLRLALLLLAMYGLLQSASLRRLLRSLGWPFYSVGLALMLLAGLLFIAAQWGAGLLGAYVQHFAANIPGLSDLLVDILRTMTGILQAPLLFYGLGFLAAAVFVQILAFALGKLAPDRPAVTVETRRPQGIRKQFR